MAFWDFLKQNTLTHRHMFRLIKTDRMFYKMKCDYCTLHYLLDRESLHDSMLGRQGPLWQP